MKAEAAKSIPSTPGTPDTASVTEVPESEASTSGSGDETVAGDSQSTISKGKQREPSEQSDDSKKETEAPRPDKGDNLVGKINNMISTDLKNITDGRDFLFLCRFIPPRWVNLSNFCVSKVLYTPLQCVVCVWFLYEILGWR